MFAKLVKINERPKPFEFYTAEKLWNDPHISKKMLEFHLNEELEPASRNGKFVKKSIDWMKSRFNIRAGTKICDFGCGPGLYTTPFAETGADVTGIDFSERSIAYASETARKKGLDINYVRQNYLDFQTDRKFDLITLIYCDFCPLSPDQRKTMLWKFHEFLENDGYVFLDVSSPAAYESKEEAATYEHKLLGGFWSEKDYYGFMNTFKYDKEKVILDKYTIFDEENSWEVYNWLQYFSLETVRKEFEENGLEIVEHYSDVSGAPYREEAPEIAIVARRKV